MRFRLSPRNPPGYDARVNGDGPAPPPGATSKEANVSSFRCLPLAALLALVLPLVARAESPPTGEQIAKWVEQLGDASFDVRQKATEALWHAGQPAEAALRKAADGTDPEVKRRARDVLDK